MRAGRGRARAPRNAVCRCRTLREGKQSEWAWKERRSSETGHGTANGTGEVVSNCFISFSL